MRIDFEKTNGLVPAIIQDAKTKKVLMLGYMNDEAYNKTLESGLVTFYSRSRKKLWTKGETSGNFLELVELKVDCDQDSLLVLANPTGPVCHTGSDTCWNEKNQIDFLENLESIITQRKEMLPDNSYVSSLFKKGLNKIAQKVGEEAVEVIIEAKDQDDDRFLNESADLLFHYLILLQAKGFKLDDVVSVLEKRNH